MVLTGSTRLWRLASLGYYRQQGTVLVLNYAQKFVNMLCSFVSPKLSAGIAR